MLTSAAIGLYAIALIAAAVSDLRHYQIPNSLSLALLAGFVLMLPALPLATTAHHVSAGLAVLAAASVLFVAGLWGGGDAKLIAAASLWFGWRELTAFLLLTAILGGLLALTLLLLRRLVPAEAAAGRWYSRLLSPAEGVPYGVAIAGAGLALAPRLIPSDPVSLG